MFALRAYAPQARQLARLPRQATLLQQKRGMAGGEFFCFCRPCSQKKTTRSRGEQAHDMLLTRLSLSPRAARVTTSPAAAPPPRARQNTKKDDEPDDMFVNWWDNPTNPDSWFKHQVRVVLCVPGTAWLPRACSPARAQHCPSLSLSHGAQHTHSPKQQQPARVVGRRLLGRRVLHHARRQQEGGGAQGARGRRRRALKQEQQRAQSVRGAAAAAAAARLCVRVGSRALACASCWSARRRRAADASARTPPLLSFDPSGF